jgi:polyhydroxyalkanoate synthase subunit PhaC
MPAEEPMTGNATDDFGLLTRTLARNDFSPCTPSRIAYEGGKLRLRHYAPVEPLHSIPILLVYALTKRAFILDLAPDRSVVQSLVQHGFHVYLTDWIPPEDCDSSRGLDAYVNEDLVKATRVIAAERGTNRVSVVGYCLGALLGVIYAASHPGHVRNLVALTVPLEMSAAAAPLPAWLTAQTVELIAALYGNCPAWVFGALSSARLRARMAQFRAEICGLEDRSEAFDRFLDWIGNDVPLAGQLFREVVIKVFGQNQLVRGELAVGGKLINLGRINCPLLNIVARFDDLVPLRTCEPLTQLVGSRDKQTIVFPSSHIGVAAGLAAHERLWPAVGQWLGVRDSRSQPLRRVRPQSCEKDYPNVADKQNEIP